MFYEISLRYELRKDGEISFECPFCWSKYKNTGLNEGVKKVFHIVESEQIDSGSVISRNVCKNIPEEYSGSVFIKSKIIEMSGDKKM
jgi:hypothetical protein